MQLSTRELQVIQDEEDLLKRNIEEMRLSNNYDGLSLKYMFAKERVEIIYKILHNHLETEYLLAITNKNREEGSDKS